jgi:hexosaminidase
MKTWLSNIFLISILISLWSCDQKNVNPEPPIIPAVNQVRMLEGEFRLDSATVLIYAEDCKKEALFLKEMIAERTGLNLEMSSYEMGVPPENSCLVNLIEGDDNSEQYTLMISPESIWLTSDGYPGLTHGFNTLAQIMDNSERPEVLPCLQIEDHPKFIHRGLLLDCSRHFMSKEYILQTLDLLAYYKMNVLHWHLTEDQGWRIEIDSYPKLTEIGAWRDDGAEKMYGGFYTKEDIREIVAYAAERHIMVIPEIEMPGHSSAAIASYPFLSCEQEQIEVQTEWGVFQDIYCAGNDSVFVFLESVLDEVCELFPAPYIHIGGDEAPKTRWENCSKCQNRIKEEGLLDEHELQSWFIERIEKYLRSKGKRLIGWDEIIEGGIPGNAIVQSWRGMKGGVEAIKEGHQTIMSPTSHAYLDYGLDAIDLEKVYTFDPIPEGTTEAESRLIMGGEVNMWSERVTEETIDQKIFPRLIAMAEILWTYPVERDYTAFVKRLRKHYSYLESKGVDFGPESVPARIQTRLDNGELQVVAEPGTFDLDIEYSLAGREWRDYTNPVLIKEDSEFLLRASLEGEAYGDTMNAQIVVHKGLHKEFNLDFTYSPQYTGGGSDALLNGRLGELNFRDGNWQAVQGESMSVTVDLGKETPIESLAANFYQYGNAWIFLPKEVKFSVSDDGEIWRTLSIINPEYSAKKKEEFIERFQVHSLMDTCRFVKMEAQNFGPNPDWHDAPGMDTWLFCDEFIIR